MKDLAVIVDSGEVMLIVGIYKGVYSPRRLTVAMLLSLILVITGREITWTRDYPGLMHMNLGFLWEVNLDYCDIRVLLKYHPIRSMSWLG